MFSASRGRLREVTTFGVDRLQAALCRARKHSPLTAPGRSEDWPLRRKRRLMQKRNLLNLRLYTAFRWSARAAQQFRVDKTS